MSDTTLVSTESIEAAVYLIRGEKVMLDRELAFLYDVETKLLNRAMKRNSQRFPPDFMFQLTPDEAEKKAAVAGVISLRLSLSKALRCSRPC